ncbi:efflux RND transporter permease subunit [Telmatocola sphagniphila]|uniref:Efflux RND transporter permease subunit n=1 Tax=Telmatocola sphagniphila TaxID=1123043 RepID=A0A8E6B6P9_9BACT|nr:efflux RND transporter permease subunit [Telmatocola sphagniphila]QVL32372.1 efflux RND transporter permease subunit [Telmatocola sphagniphila]
MIRKLIAWSLENPIIVILLAFAFAGIGVYSYLNVNVEAYPDPAPAIVEVYAQFPGASAEEVERQVTIPLEVTFAGMPGLKFIHSKSLFGLSDLKMNWNYGSQWTYEAARQEVINRIATISQPLPPGVQPTISPESPTGEIYRYVLTSPKNSAGNPIYTLNDLKAMEDWTMEREFRAVPRVVDLTSYGGTIRRYEVQADPDRLRRYGITLSQLQNAIQNSNATVGGDYVNQGQVALTVRSVGLFGGGMDPVNKVLGLKDPNQAAAILRNEEYRRICDIRSLVVASVNNQPVRVEDLVVGGRVSPGLIGLQGVVVSNQTRLGQMGYWKADRKREPGSEETLLEVGHDEPDMVQCIVLMRKGEQTLPALKDVKKKVEEINDPESGRRLPGVFIEPYYDRTDLLSVTTETVSENMIMGVLLVVVILFMFVSNIKTALIVAVNIPLALLFAFSMLFLRDKSANLLSIGAVDFGIIVDSSVIMVENIYRNLASGNYPDLPIKDRILKFVTEIDNALLFSTLIMVCAFVPLFTMSGAEGELFRPMAQTYAFSLAGALLLTLTLTPVLCMIFFKNLKPVRENFLVRFLKARYIFQLKLCLKYRWMTLFLMTSLIVYTATLIPHLGHEFMPELEEGNLWIRSTGPLNQTLERNIQIAKQARLIIASYPEVESIVTQSGRPDDGTDIEGYENTEYFVPMRPRKDWPKIIEETSTWKTILYGPMRARTKDEVIRSMNEEFSRKIPGVVWNFSQNIRDNVMEALSGFKGDNSVKIIGPDIVQLESLAEKVKNVLRDIPGMEDVGVIHEMGQSHLEFRVDPEKCQRWGVMTADVNNVVSSALGAKAMSSMVEGEKLFDISIRWPLNLRNNESSILDIPVDIVNNQVVLPQGSSFTPSASGHALPPPSVTGSLANTANPLSNSPRLRLRELVSPVGPDGAPDPNGQFERAGAAAIFREQGKRLIAIKFSVRGRDLGSVVEEAQQKTKDLIQSPYRMVWAGEFEQMEDAQRRLLWIVPFSLILIFIFLYMAFRSFLDAIVIFSNVFDVAVGGIWALYLTGTTFSVSAAVGFISLFGIAIMEGLLMISYFNALRLQGLPLQEAIVQGAGKRVRPVMITAMTAILGLLPAALSTKIGAQTAKPLAIVVVGGMILTLFVDRYLMPVLYTFYGNRAPNKYAGGLAH